MPVESAGLLMCRKRKGNPEFFLVHPGGPFFTKKDKGVWTIPKGLPEPNETLQQTAIREFIEETGIEPKSPFFPLGAVRQTGGKIVHAWAFLGEWDESVAITSNKIDILWPPRSGKYITIPEADRAEWMGLDRAVMTINPRQVPFLEKASVLFQ